MVVQAGTSSRPYLPHALAATLTVVVLPAVAVALVETSGRAWVVLLAVLVAIGLSVGAATLGCAIWSRRPGSRDLVFADLMLWGWLRRVRAERCLAEVQGLVESGAGGVELLQRLADRLEAKDARTLGHSKRVTRHAERIARELGLPGAEVTRVRTAASVHDVGKVHTPSRILVKPGALTDREFEVMKRHSVDGAEMVATLGVPEVTAMVRHHHERLDGSGYPDGLRGEEIPLGARIIAVADTFDAMTSSRAYRAARTHREALDVLAEEAGVRLDADAVAAFDRYYSDRRSVAWSALGLAGPPRLVGWIGGLLNGGGGWGAPLAQGIAGIAAVALVGASPAGHAAFAPAAPAHEPPPAGATRTALDREAPRTAAPPFGEPARRRSAQAAPGGRSPGRPVLVGGPPASGDPAPEAGPSPSGDSPEPAAPGLELPNVEVQEVQLPPVDLPAVEVPSVKLPSVEPPDLAGTAATELLPDAGALLR